MDFATHLYNAGIDSADVDQCRVGVWQRLPTVEGRGSDPHGTDLSTLLNLTRFVIPTKAGIQVAGKAGQPNLGTGLRR